MAVNNFDLRDLKRFKASLVATLNSNRSGQKNAKIEEISDMAYEEISLAYSTTDFTVTKPLIIGSKATIYAKGEEIAFDEFGTGKYAEGSYKGELPTQPIFFESAKYQQVTIGWEYYYKWYGVPSLNPKKRINGIFGWFTTKDSVNFHIGQNASNRFYDAVQRIKKNIKENK